VLEIGSGWGAIAIEMAKRYQCRVTSITLSKEQQKLAQERVSQEGLQDYVDIQLCDYRNLTGKFDRIVSVEMIEAVGHEYLHEFFRICDQVLKPQGRIVLQVITIPDQHYERYRKSCDWIQKHIFPGGHLPSIEILKKATRKASSLAIKHVENIGPHYAKTLNEWRSRFLASADKISSLGYSHEIQRKWDFYFSYCEAAFRTQYLDNLQLVLAR